MVHRLKVANVLSIKQLHAQGWSQRKIARELGVSRAAVARHLKNKDDLAQAEGPSESSNEAKAPTGLEEQLSTSNKAGHRPQVGRPTRVGQSLRPVSRDDSCQA